MVESGIDPNKKRIIVALPFYRVLRRTAFSAFSCHSRRSLCIFDQLGHDINCLPACYGLLVLAFRKCLSISVNFAGREHVLAVFVIFVRVCPEPRPQCLILHIPPDFGFPSFLLDHNLPKLLLVLAEKPGESRAML